MEKDGALLDGVITTWKIVKPIKHPEPQPDTGMLQVGQPVLRVGQGGALLDGVIIDVERGGAALLVAIACRGRLAGVDNGARSAATSYRCGRIILLVLHEQLKVRHPLLAWSTESKTT